jgi:hypothetical protein
MLNVPDPVKYGLALLDCIFSEDEQAECCYENSTTSNMQFVHKTSFVVYKGEAN